MFGFGKSSQDKLLDQIFELKFTSKGLVKAALKCQKEQKAEKLKVKQAIEKGNIDGARIYAQNAIRKKTEELNYLRLSSRLDAVVSRLDTQAKMSAVTKSMGAIVKALDVAVSSGNLEKISMTMDKFEKQMESLDVAATFVDEAMAGSTAMSTPEDEVTNMLQQVAEEHGLEVSAALPQAGQEAVKGKEKSKEEDDLMSRLAALKST